VATVFKRDLFFSSTPDLRGKNMILGSNSTEGVYAGVEWQRETKKISRKGRLGTGLINNDAS